MGAGNRVSVSFTYSKWFKGIYLAILCFALLFGAVAIGLSTWSLIRDDFASKQAVYRDHAQMGVTPFHHVVDSLAPLEITIPTGNLSPYVGRVYHFDCISGQNHTLLLQGGLATWDGVNSRAKCGVSVAGFSFKVSSPIGGGIRILSQTGMTFSA